MTTVNRRNRPVGLAQCYVHLSEAYKRKAMATKLREGQAYWNTRAWNRAMALHLVAVVRAREERIMAFGEHVARMT